MNKLSSERITSLLENATGGPAVTMYVPSHKVATPPNMHEDQTRFKNLMNKALETLNNRDKHNPFNKYFKDQCEALLNDKLFWENLSQSFILTARPDMFEVTHLPVDSDEYVAVDDHFHLAPIYGLCEDMQPYYVLLVSLKNPRLYRGDSYGLELMDAELPKSVSEALNVDEMHTKSIQFHSGAGMSVRAGMRGPSGGSEAMFHGHGAGKDSGNAEKEQYLRILDAMMNKHIDTSLPLILAGVEAEVSEFKSLSKHGNILKAFARGNFTESNTAELHHQTQAILHEEVIEIRHQKAIEDFERLQGEDPDRATTQFANIKDAAESGRAGTLLLALTRKTTDTVRDNTEQVMKIIFPADKISQAIDYIAQQAWRNGSKILNIIESKAPGRALVAATMRY